MNDWKDAKGLGRTMTSVITRAVRVSVESVQRFVANTRRNEANSVPTKCDISVEESSDESTTAVRTDNPSDDRINAELFPRHSDRCDTSNNQICSSSLPEIVRPLHSAGRYVNGRPDSSYRFARQT